MKIGLMLSMPGDLTGVAGLVDRARNAESDGFASAWLPQVSGLDAMAVLAMAGRETERIELGTAVVPTYPRHPTVMAGQALTVQDASNGRFSLGIGLSHKMVIEDSLGLDYSRPIPHTREYLTVLNGLLSGERVEFEGTLYQVAAQITVKGASKPPVLVAALGPDMLRLCGRLADGTVTWMGGLSFLRDAAVPIMSASAEAADRPDPRFVTMVPILLTDEADAGRELVNTAFQMYGRIPSYRNTLDRGGADLPADVAVIGRAADIEAGLRAYADAGTTDFVAVIPMNAGADGDQTRGFIAGLARTGLA